MTGLPGKVGKGEMPSFEHLAASQDEKPQNVIPKFKQECESVRAYSAQAVEGTILRALKGMRYGSVEIIIHDSKVVQIERKEMTLFDGMPSHSIRSNDIRSSEQSS